jgi:hypothetical protein
MGPGVVACLVEHCCSGDVQEIHAKNPAMLLKSNLFGDKTPFESRAALNYWDIDSWG